MTKPNISDMCDGLFKLYILWAAEMQRRNIPFMLTRVACTVLEQSALLVQGRMELKYVNMFRKEAGLYLLKSERENKIVTWTLLSKHVTNKYDSNVSNDKSRAFDFAIMRDKKPTWDLKVNVNANELDDYHEAGVIAESAGLRWLGHIKDYCHCEVAD